MPGGENSRFSQWPLQSNNADMQVRSGLRSFLGMRLAERYRAYQGETPCRLTSTAFPPRRDRRGDNKFGEPLIGQPAKCS